MYWVLKIEDLRVEKPVSLTTLRRNEVCRLTFRILTGLPGRSELARSGQRVRFFHYPNPFDDFIRVDMLSEQSHQIIIDMIDMNGRIIEYMYTGTIEANLMHHFELNTNLDLIPGFYMIRIRTKHGESLGREMILKQ